MPAPAAPAATKNERRREHHPDLGCPPRTSRPLALASFMPCLVRILIGVGVRSDHPEDV